MKYTTLALFFIFYAFAKAQTPPVELIEEKLAKRWNIYAQNNSDEEHEAFLMIQGEGFRRSADRPIIKKIPPQSKVLMITLIPLKGVEPKYTKVFTYEKQLQTIKRRKGDGIRAYANIRPLEYDELTVFIESDCAKCTYVLDYLNEHHIKYRLLDVNTHNDVKDFMFDHLKEDGYKGGLVALPAVMYKGRKHWDIVDIKKFTEVFDWE